ncbi:MAG TPA: amidase [Polyangia bacterium]|jgi:amidase|nr:amidase [Polyangia bacterium]
MSDREDAPPGTQLSRRTFLGWSALGGALATLGTMETALAGETPQETGPATPALSDLEEATIPRLQEGMRSGRYTARALVEAYLARISMLDQEGPALNQIIELNPEALAIADRLDAERKARKLRGPLHGIPILLKDNIDTADRMATTAGSLALAGSIATHDAFIAARLRAAGAILLGKTNMSEWANFRSNRSSSGWSGRGGQGRNPYALSHNTSGSSSGSAAAVAANLCAAAIGTETDGSIVSPASCCGIVGIKPTLGLLSRSGIIPIAHSQDTAGPMARTVTDAAILLGVLAGVDPRDEATREGPGANKARAQTDYTRFLDPNSLRGARLGIARAPTVHVDPESVRLLDAAVALMKDRGAIVIDPVEIATSGKFDDAEQEVLLHEFKADLNRYLSALGPGVAVHSLAEVIAWNEQHRAEELQFFGQELMIMAEDRGPLTSKTYLDALAHCRELSRAQGIDAALQQHRLDAIVAVTNGPAWPIDLVNGDHYTGGSSTLAAVAGYPSITVPAGHIFGLPVGISFFGTAFSEPQLLKLAYAYEQVSRARRPPTFRPAPEIPDRAYRRAPAPAPGKTAR